MKKYRIDFYKGLSGGSEDCLTKRVYVEFANIDICYGYIATYLQYTEDATSFYNVSLCE